MTVAVIIAAYLVSGWIISLTLPAKYDESDGMFAFALFLWPVIIPFWIFYTLAEWSVKARQRIRK